jgi:cbb3-type cytochrome oxidase maturation protein
VSILFLLIPLAVLLAGGAVIAFVWSTTQGQFDDLETPALRMLHDDDEPRVPSPPTQVE